MTNRNELIARVDRVIVRTGYQPIEKMAPAIVDELEPIIRADERAKFQCPMPCCDEEASDE